MRQFESRVRNELPTECQKYRTRCGAAAHEARAENYIGFALHEGIEHVRIFGRIVFEIGVLNNDEVASCLLDPAAQSRPFAHVVGLEEDAHLRMPLFQFG